jgi:hypothetical protein
MTTLSKTKEELIVGLLAGLSSLLEENSGQLPDSILEAKNKIVNALAVVQNTNSTEIDIEALRANLISLRSGAVQSKAATDEKNLRSDMNDGVLSKHERYGEKYNSVLETVRAYADEILRAITTSLISDVGGAIVDTLTGRERYVVSTDEERYAFAGADRNLTRSGARDLGLRIKDYIDKVKQHNINTLQRWTVRYNINEDVDDLFSDLLSYYTMEVELPFPEISSGVIDIGTYIRDVMSVENKPIRLSILIDLKMHTVGVFSNLIKISGDANNAMLGYKDDYKINFIGISIEDNALGEVSYIEFLDCIVRDISSVTLRHEYSDYRLIEVEIEYDYATVDYGKLTEYSKLSDTDTFRENESRTKEYYKQSNVN